jgi:hypothetical protein
VRLFWRARLSMMRCCRFRSVLLALLLTTVASAGAPITTAIDRLHNAADFRVRVQAALELGKSRDQAARVALERALGDSSVSVRAAAAAALGALGDVRSLPALQRRRGDGSGPVRSEIERALAKLTAKDQQRKKATLIVKIGKVHVTDQSSRGLASQLAAASRSKLGQLPGVLVLEEGEEAQPSSRVPMVMVTGSLRKIGSTRDGSQIVYSARVEYILHRMPEQNIAGTVSGSARTKATPEEASNKRKDAELQLLVLEAAVESAMRRAPEALLAVVR